MSFRKVVAWLAFVPFALAACAVNEATDSQPQNVDMEAIVVPAGFDFSNRLEHEFRVEVVDPRGRGLAGVAVRLFNERDELVVSAATGPSGVATVIATLPAHHSSVVVETPAIGVVHSRRSIELVGTRHSIVMR